MTFKVTTRSNVIEPDIAIRIITFLEAEDEALFFFLPTMLETGNGDQ